MKRHSVSKGFFVLLALILTVTLVSPDAHAKRKRRHRYHHKTKRAVINEPKLYERIGGSKGVSTIVDEWLRTNFSDPRLGELFSDAKSRPDQMPKLRRTVSDQICEMADGPCGPNANEAKKAIDAMTTDESRFLAYADNLFKSMQKQGLPERDKNEMLGRLGEARTQMMTESEDETED